MKNTTYKIIVNGVCIEEEPLQGLAWMKWNSLKLCLETDFYAEFQIHFIGDDGEYDPILHGKKIKIIDTYGVYPECCSNPETCPYRKSVANEFNTTVRKTAFRTEVICPSDRCGWKLKPGCIGGHFYDYDFCTPCNQ